MAWKWCRVGAMLAALLMLGAFGNPEAGATSLAQRRAEARSMIRFGRSYPAEPSAAEIRELIKQPISSETDFNRIQRSMDFVRFGRSPEIIRFGRSHPDFVRFGRRQPDFVRFGRSKPAVPEEEIATVLQKYYGASDEEVDKREPSHIRFGRNVNSDSSGEKKNDRLFQTSGLKPDKGNKFLRLGRSQYEDGDDETFEVERRKRSACTNCSY